MIYQNNTKISMQFNKDRIKKQVLPLLGLLLVIILYLPVLIMKENALFIIHDQMDGEILVYIEQVKNCGKNIIPELLGGISSTALTPASPGTLLFYFLFKPVEAYIFNYIFVAIVAYVGMYLCVEEIWGEKWIAVIVAVVFSILPFYSVYGLSIMGQPLFFYACYNIFKDKGSLKSYVIIIFFAFFSSLVLVGYADILILFFSSVVESIRKRKNARGLWIATVVLTGTYVIEFHKLLCEMFSPFTSYVSHKSEIVVKAKPLMATFKDIFENGMYHAASCHKDILFACIVVGVVLLLYSHPAVEKKYVNCFIGLFGAAVGIAFFYAGWNYWPIVNIRNKMGGLFVSFQVDRFYWLYPGIWYLLFAGTLYFIWKTSTKKWSKMIVCLVFVILVGKNVYTSSTVKVNIDRFILKQNYTAEGYQTWKKFYSEQLFENIKKYIGKPVEEYKVGSIGLYPSIAMYNGFYCIDGYSNNYDVKYKHEFRKIISKELEKNSSLRSYFDDWGNRCYLFAAEIPYEYQITKNDDRTLKGIELNVEQLKKMGCEYLFSALPIESDTMKDEIEFCRKFTEKDSPYSIYLYKININE